MATAIQTLSSRLITAEEQARAAAYLASTRDSLLETLAGLSDAQWHFKPSPDRWSAAEILEHVAIIEDRVHGIVGMLPNAPAAEPGRDDSQIDNFILANVPLRTSKVQAPPPARPAGQCNPAETMARFAASRAQTGVLLATAPELRGHVLPHPVLGSWDGYQWILAVAGHTARHTSQILELKADRAYPN